MAPGVFGWGDLEGDGDIDLAVSGDGDPRVFLFLQQDGTFTQHTLLEDLSQAGGMVFSDLDGNGTTELVVTGYDADSIFIFEVESD